MEDLEKEKNWKKRIAAIKWEYGYQCIRCECKEYYPIYRNYSRRCKNKTCNYEETVMIGTAFEDSNISITVKMEMLFFIRDKIYSNKRIPINKLAERFGINENTITLFFKKIHLFMEQKGTHLGGDTLRELDSEGMSPTDKFCSGLNYEQAEVYSCLHGLLTVPGGNQRSKKGILILLVTGNDIMDWFD